MSAPRDARPGRDARLGRGARLGAQPLERHRETPSQTAGPYVHIGCTPNAAGIEGVFETDLGAGALYAPDAKGERIAVAGRVLDGGGAALTDALVEIWQADAAGLFPGAPSPRGAPDPAFRGFGRCATDARTGEYRFETLRPGRVPYPDGRWQAPHLTFWIVARGINVGLHTRMYFADETEANAADPLLNRVEHVERRQTLIAAFEGGVHRFDIRLQGERETVFLDI